ncbi:MAG: type IV pilus modification protein PilV [Candidatus Thiodiazotropha sp. (ex. Lucinoma kazani)]
MSLIAYRQKNQGMTLIEVLIAAIIVAIGLLGVASMQIAALQGSNNAGYRSRAIDIATALSDRMHANLIGVANNHYLRNPACDTGSSPAVPNCAMTPTMAIPSSIAECTPEQMAFYDLYQINCDSGIQDTLPDGRLQIACLDSDRTDADGCSDLSHQLITISWQRQRRVTDTDPNDVEEIIMTAIPGVP